MSVESDGKNNKESSYKEKDYKEEVDNKKDGTSGDIERMEEDKKLKELEELKKKHKELHERFIRLAADFDNYRKRVAKEKSDIAEYGNEELIKSLLDVIDNLERALLHAETGNAGSSLQEGIELVYNQLNNLLQKFGVERVEAGKGTMFDPRFHQAFEKVETEEVSPGLILEEMVKGYIFKGRLLRPAVVSVAAGIKEKKEEDKPQTSKEESGQEEDNVVEINIKDKGSS